MKKKLVLLVLCSMTVCFAACGGNTKETENIWPSESVSVAESSQPQEASETASDAESSQAQEASETTSEAESSQPQDTSETVSDAESSQAQEASESVSEVQGVETTDVITEKQALEAIKNHYLTTSPDLAEKMASEDYTIFFDVTTNEDNLIVVLYRSYTGAENRYYVDPVSGDTFVTERVPGIIDEEQRTEETLNIRDYFD